MGISEGSNTHVKRLIPVGIEGLFDDGCRPGLLAPNGGYSERVWEACIFDQSRMSSAAPGVRLTEYISFVQAIGGNDYEPVRDDTWGIAF